MSRIRLLPFKIKDPETEHVLELARAGMARKLIATEVYGTDPCGLQRVHYILGRERTGVTEYRNGKNSLGRSVIAAIRREANIIGAIRQAAKRQSAAFKRKVS
jgi:hypothetical protein